jgi:hypothetical protein
MTTRTVVLLSVAAMLGVGVLAFSLKQNAPSSDPPDNGAPDDDPPAIRRARRRRQKPAATPVDPVPDPLAPTPVDSATSTTPDPS